MPLLETIKQMQQQGMQNSEIAQRLREEGFNAKDIDDSLSQSNIKAAVYEESGNPSIVNQEMQPSMMPQEISPATPQEQMQQYPQYPPYTQYTTQQDYYQPASQEASTEMMTEIAEQIVAEKFSEIKKTIGNISDFKSLIESKVYNLDERLKRIELTIDKLQSAILNKISGSLQGIQDIKDEMGMMQDSFSKVINPLRQEAMEKMENMPEEETQEQTKKDKDERQKKSKNKQDFEDFLR